MSDEIAFRAPRFTKPAAPKVKTRQFYWDKLPAFAVSSTVWGDLGDGASGVQLDMNDLVSTFSIESASATSASALVTSPTRKQSVTTLLDITRANNIAIMLSRIKLDLPGIRRALLGMSDVLSVDDLKAIGKQLPTAEEMNRIKDFGGDTSKLAKADQYFCQIMDIPRLPERLECMLYRRKLDLDIEEIRPELAILRNACTELKGSKKFKQVLQAVLAIGNVLNGSTFRGGARGFQLEGLSKLKETKTVKGGAECPTLLHYLAKVLMRSDPALINFIEELPHLEPAARVSVQTITQAVNQLLGGLERVREEVRYAQARGKGDGEDRFVLVMQPFVAKVSPSVEALKNMGQLLDGQMKALLAYYGEQTDTAEARKPEDFFGLISSFSTSLQKCGLEVHEAQVKMEATRPKVTIQEPEESTSEATVRGDANRNAIGEQKDGGMLSPPSSQGYAAGKSVGRGDLDQAIRSMREGKRRARPARPLSKIFLDGAPPGRPQSRMFD